MPDISMCNGKGCNLKNDCYRYLAIPNEFGQSYFSDTVFKNPENCDYIWNIPDKLKDKLRKIRDENPRADSD